MVITSTIKKFEALVKKGLKSPTSFKVVWTASTLAAGVLVITAVLVVLRQLQRRRIIRNQFQQAYLRDPSLTWDEYERRGRLTRSRLMFEEDIQRSVMIRKCQQSRASDCKDTVAVEGVDIRPIRSRSRTWHGHSRRSEWEDSDVEQARRLPRGTVADWYSAEASVDRTWQLLHRSKSPLARNGLLRNQPWETDACALQLAPIARPKTPPLLSHPLFRDGSHHYRPKHVSLPTELTRARIDMGSSR